MFDEDKLDEILRLMREIRSLLAQPPEPVYRAVYTSSRGIVIVRDDGRPTPFDLAERYAAFERYTSAN